MVALVIVGIILTGIIGYFVFAKTSPQFGGSISDAQKKEYKKSPRFKDGIFHNEIPTKMDMGVGGMLYVTYEFFKGASDREPNKLLPQQKLDSTKIADRPNSVTQLTWFGHSTFLLEIHGQNILVDPMLGDVAAPLPIGPKRFNKELPISIEALPKIDAVILSHDHYDHLDFESIKKLKDKVEHFYTPLGVGAHLKSWGVNNDKITELDWWEELDHNGIKLITTPARHFSGRGLGNRFSTLWCGWIIQSEDKKIYFSGDSGYGSHFKEIGEKYGPFDFALLECGQYNERWKDIHMMPEESAQAAVDVNAKMMMPIHWGAFNLALHSWTDPIERVTKKADELNMPITTPIIGEPIKLKEINFPQSKWWQ